MKLLGLLVFLAMSTPQLCYSQKVGGGGHATNDREKKALKEIEKKVKSFLNLIKQKRVLCPGVLVYKLTDVEDAYNGILELEKFIDKVLIEKLMHNFSTINLKDKSCEQDELFNCIFEETELDQLKLVIKDVESQIDELYGSQIKMFPGDDERRTQSILQRLYSLEDAIDKWK